MESPEERECSAKITVAVEGSTRGRDYGCELPFGHPGKHSAHTHAGITEWDEAVPPGNFPTE
jgi:hypothetical protein